MSNIPQNHYRKRSNRLAASNYEVELDGIYLDYYFLGEIYVGSSLQKMDLVWDTGSSVRV